MQSLVVRWDKMGPEFTYCVWYSRQPKGPFIRHNAIRLTDDIIDRLRGIVSGEYYQTLGYNEYLITGLEEETNYSVKVTCHDRYDAWWYSQSSYTSIEGGAGSSGTSPSPSGGNIANFQIYING